MKIQNITVSNIRGAKSVAFQPKQVTYISGPSGAGKSSVIKALRYCLTGKSYEDMVRLGADTPAYAEADIEGFGTLKRVTNGSVNKVYANGELTSAKSITQMFESLYGISQTSMALTTSSEMMENALGKELAAYLLESGFLKNDMTLSHLLSLITVSEDVVAALKNLLPNDPAVITLDDISKAHTLLLEKRPVVKRKLQDMEAIANQETVKPTDTIANLEQKVNELVAKIGIAAKEAAEYPKRLQQQKDLENKIATAEEKIKSCGDVKPVSQSELATATEHAKTAASLVNDTTVHIKSVQTDIAMLDKLFNSLETTGCPLSDKLVCTTDKTPLKAEVEEAFNRKYDEAAALKAKLQEYEQQKDAAEELVSNLNKQVYSYKVREAWEAQLRNLKAIHIEIPEQPDSEQLAIMQHALEEAKQKLQEARFYQSVCQSKEQVLVYKQKLATCEALIKQLAPNGGIRKLILSNAIGVLEEFCNKQLSVVLPHWKLYFDADNNFEIMLQNKDGAISYHSLSNGEQLKVIFVIMCMLNELSGVRVLLLDNLNALDPEAFASFIDLVDKLRESYDHVFISGIDATENFSNYIAKMKTDHVTIQMLNGKTA